MSKLKKDNPLPYDALVEINDCVLGTSVTGKIKGISIDDVVRSYIVELSPIYKRLTVMKGYSSITAQESLLKEIEKESRG